MAHPSERMRAVRAALVEDLAGIGAFTTGNVLRHFDAAGQIVADAEKLNRPEWLVVEETRKTVWAEIGEQLGEQYREQVDALGQRARNAIRGMAVVERARKSGRKTVRVEAVWDAMTVVDLGNGTSI